MIEIKLRRLEVKKGEWKNRLGEEKGMKCREREEIHGRKIKEGMFMRKKVALHFVVVAVILSKFAVVFA